MSDSACGWSAVSPLGTDVGVVVEGSVVKEGSVVVVNVVVVRVVVGTVGLEKVVGSV